MSENIKILLRQDFVDVFILAKIEPAAETTIRYTTLPYDVTYKGQLYSSSNLLQGIDAPKLSTVLDKDSYKIVFADPDFTLRSSLEYGMYNSELTVIGGFVNTLSSTIGGAEPGQPLLEDADTFMAYKGNVDMYAYKVDTSGDTFVTLEGASPMGALGLTKSLLTSKEWMRARHTTDTSFDQIYIGSKQETIKWGKA